MLLALLLNVFEQYGIVLIIYFKENMVKIKDMLSDQNN